jgi:hypothetical protein
VLVLPTEDKITTPPAPLLPLGPIERQSFDYSGLDAATEPSGERRTVASDTRTLLEELTALEDCDRVLAVPELCRERR